MSEVSESMIAEWKKKFGEVYEIEVLGSKCWVKKPGRKELSAATTLASRGNNIDPFKFSETILDTCFLGGDETIKSDDDKFLAVLPYLESITQRAEASIKKL
jgi:hypothetical protein